MILKKVPTFVFGSLPAEVGKQTGILIAFASEAVTHSVKQHISPQRT